MQGSMMNMPLQISSLIRHAERWHGDTEVVSRMIEGGIHRYTYTEAHRRTRQLANALQALGVKMHDRVGTLAWNGFRHFETYYAVAGMGARHAPALDGASVYCLYLRRNPCPRSVARVE